MKKHSLSVWLPVIGMLVALTAAQGSSQADLPEPGPENGGLRLRLSIITSRQDTNDVYSVRLGIINVSSEPVILVGQPGYERHAKDYATFLKSIVSFVTFPEILPPLGQTAGIEPKSAPPKTTIKPQEEFVVRWRSSGRRLKRQDYLNTTPCFPSEGLYGVRAKVVIRTEEGREILLFSNQQRVCVGGSVELPKHATARITRTDVKNNAVIIDLGTHHKIQVGDRFHVSGGHMGYYWELTVSSTSAWVSEAAVLVHQGSAPQIDALPPRLATAHLAPPEVSIRRSQDN